MQNTEVTRNVSGTGVMNNMDMLVAEIRAIMETARANVSREINTTMLATYWQVGRTIVESEQNGSLKAEYGKKLLPELSKRLTKELGKGYSRSNLQNMRLLYHEYPEICQTPSGKLTWSHYIELLAVQENKPILEKDPQEKTARGILHEFARTDIPNIEKLEKDAWREAAEKKHANS